MTILEAELATKQDILALKHDIELVRRDMQDLEARMTIKLGTMMVLVVGAVAALVKML